jgi:hypothetical protein
MSRPNSVAQRILDKWITQADTPTRTRTPTTTVDHTPRHERLGLGAKPTTRTPTANNKHTTTTSTTRPTPPPEDEDTSNNNNNNKKKKKRQTLDSLKHQLTSAKKQHL